MGKLAKSPKTLNCKKCGKNLRKQSYKAHMNLHTGKCPFRCPRCPKAYPSQTSLKRHVKYWCHKQKGGAKTGLSAASVEPTDTVSTEMVVSIPVQVSVLCHGNAKKTADSELATQSLPAVTLKSTGSASISTSSSAGRASSDKPFLCSVCNQRYATKKSLYDHDRRKHGNVHNSVGGKKSDNVHKVVSDKPFLCSICNQRYATKKSLYNHTRLRHGIANNVSDKPFPCSLCDRGYFNKRSLCHHNTLKHATRNVNSAKPFVCPLCNRTFASKKSLKEHIKRMRGKATHIVDSSFSCSLCDGVYATEKYLRRHIGRMHGSLGQSKSAPLVTGRNTDRIAERKDSSMERVHISAATVASTPSRSQGSLTDAREATSGAVCSKPCYPCGSCDLVLESLEQYKVHLHQHSSRSRFQCVVCSRVYPNARKLWLHQRRIHKHFRRTTQQVPTAATVAKQQALVCSVCCRSYKTQNKLDAHMKLSHGPCPKCGIILSDVLHYKAHMKEHLRRRTFRCQWCSKHFYSTGSLRGHSCVIKSGVGRSKRTQVAAHKSKRKEVPSPLQCAVPQDPVKMALQPLIVPCANASGCGYKCVFCGKVLSRRQLFTDHMNIHTGARPYVCEVCGATFTGNAQRHRHWTKEHANSHVHPPKQHQTAMKQVTMSSIGKSRHTPTSSSEHKMVPSERVASETTDDELPTAKGSLNKQSLLELECASSTHEQVDKTPHDRDSNGPSFSCGVCGTTMQRYDLYMAHMSQHNSRPTHHCSQCPTSFPTVATLQRHMECAHSQHQQGSSTGNKTDAESKQFTCTECGRSYKRQCDHTKHMQRRHPQPRHPAYMQLRGREHLPPSPAEPPEAMECEETTDRMEVNSTCDVDMGLEVECGVQGDDDGVVPKPLESSPSDRGRGSECEVLPVCGEVQVGGSEEGHTDPHSGTIFMKYGSWNVFFFGDNTVS